MQKLRNTTVVFLIILLQGVSALIAGSFATFYRTGNTAPEGTTVYDIDISGLSYEQAKEKLSDQFFKVLSDGNLKLSISGAGDFEIPYFYLGAVLDVEATLDGIYSDNSVLGMFNTVRAAFFNESKSIDPVIKINEGRLKQQLSEISKKIEKEPQNASIDMEGSRLKKKAETDGLKLNVDKAAEVIMDRLEKNPMGEVVLSQKAEDGLELVAADVRLKDIEEIEGFISSYSTPITSKEIIEAANKATKALNGIIIAPEGNPAAGNAEFSFVEKLKKADPLFANDSEGYDQVASTLYAAVLKAGIKKEAIYRLPHSFRKEYIDPGLDVLISGNDGDLRFRNTLKHKIAIFAGVEGDQVTVRIAGSLSDKKQENEVLLKAETVQTFKPSVTLVENNNLKPGEMIVINSGENGMLVRLYRGNELISTDKYEAVSEIIQVGPGTKLPGTADDTSEK